MVQSDFPFHQNKNTPTHHMPVRHCAAKDAVSDSAPTGTAVAMAKSNCMALICLAAIALLPLHMRRSRQKVDYTRNVHVQNDKRVCLWCPVGYVTGWCDLQKRPLALLH